MRTYGNLTTGAGIQTTFTGDFVPQVLQIGDGVSSPNIQGISVSAGGLNPVRALFPNSLVLETIMQLGANAQFTDNGNKNPVYLFPIGDGHQGNESFEVTITNNGVNTPAVKGYSINPGNKVYTEIVTATMQASDNKLYSYFDALVFESTNFDRATVQFTNGHTEPDMDEDTLRTLLSLTSNINLRVADKQVIAIDNRLQNIASIQLFTTSSGTMSVAQILNI